MSYWPALSFERSWISWWIRSAPLVPTHFSVQWWRGASSKLTSATPRRQRPTWPLVNLQRCQSVCQLHQGTRQPRNPPPPLKFWDVWRGDSEASVVSETVRRWGVLVPPSPLISNNWQSGQMWPMWSGLGSRCELEWSTGWSIMLLEAASCSTRPTCCPSLYSASATASSTQVPWRRWSGPYSSVWSLGRAVT